ncbi:MAG TPA: hypothetical protein VK464_04525 [Symbiobacteriaceae bacterium]|nr:hypothetical protein [Symbiobacteriaceae bacterium]
MSTVEAPVSLLLDPALTPTAKVLWLAVRAHHQPAQGAKRKPRSRPKVQTRPRRSARPSWPPPPG